MTVTGSAGNRKNLGRNACLPVCVTFALALSAPTPGGAAPYSSLNAALVSTCGDSGPGSLRDAIDHAVSGTTIDLRNLTCATITLTTGALHIATADLQLLGPGSTLLSIDGGAADTVVDHTSAGLLQLSGLTVTNGRRSDGDGGCVSTQGDLLLDDVIVSKCELHSLGDTARGGGVFAAGDIEMRHSTVTGCALIVDFMHSSPAGFGAGLYAGGSLELESSTLRGNRFSIQPEAMFSPANGGGASVRGDLNMHESTIADNLALGMISVEGRGGGLNVSGDAFIENSTLSGNTASYGGAAVLNSGSLINSTISGNEGVRHTSGIVVSAPFAIIGSTITSDFIPHEYADGLYIRSGAVDVVSTIIAGSGNVTQIGGNEFAGAAIHGHNNLFTGPTRLYDVPADTIAADPRLLPLADNGGLTKTHALDRNSPAINAGDDAIDAPFDQRGSPCKRVVGLAADIGAIETQKSASRIDPSGESGSETRSVSAANRCF